LSILFRKKTYIILILLFSTILNAAEKRNIGILPFTNVKKQAKFDWLSFGFDYLLRNKLANIASFYVPEENIIKKALNEAGYNANQNITGEVVYRIGKDTGINIGIAASYITNGQAIEVNLSFLNAFNGATIFSKQYRNSFQDIFTIVDDIAQNIIQITAVNLNNNEQTLVNRKITTSVKAFESFCLGYIENEKPKKQKEIIVGLFRKAIREDPKFWEAYYNLGIAYFNEQDYNNALQQFDKIITSLPNFEKPYFGRALIYLRTNEYQKAKTDFIKVTQFNPNDYKPYYYLGQIGVILKQYADANKYLKKAAEINPDYGNTYFEMGNIFFNQNKHQLAIPHYKKAVELDPSNMNSHFRLGESFYRVQTYYSAYSEFKKVLQIDPNNSNANFMKGITAYKQAVLSELIEAFLEIFDPEAASQQKAKKVTGTQAERTELYKEMATSFYNAHKARNGFFEATFNLALTYHEMGKLDSSLIFYKKSLETKPDLVRAHIKLAQVYELKKDKPNALLKYKEVVTIDPAYFVAHPALGALFNYINVIDVVLKELDGKLKANPNEIKSNQTLAKIYYAQGFHGKAANLYRKILSINPNDQEAKKMLTQIEKG
jgi:tetratricopeptide (TPR) repeat protein